MYALDALYSTHPAVQAARTVLHAQLLSGGLALVRDGEVLKEVAFGETDAQGQRKKGVTKNFNEHLDEHWLPFAKDVIDCFIKWGVAPVVLDVLEEDPAIEAIRVLKAQVGIEGPLKRKTPPPPPKLVPHVPILGTYEIAWKASGKYGYTRTYFVYNNAPGQATRLDEEAQVYVRQHPDSVGNCNSPLATVVSSSLEHDTVHTFTHAQPLPNHLAVRARQLRPGAHRAGVHRGDLPQPTPNSDPASQSRAGVSA